MHGGHSASRAFADIKNAACRYNSGVVFLLEQRT